MFLPFVKIPSAAFRKIETWINHDAKILVLILLATLYQQAYGNCSEKNVVYKKLNPTTLRSSNKPLAKKTVPIMAFCSMECTNFKKCVSFVYYALATTANCELYPRNFKPHDLNGVAIYSKDYSTESVQLTQNCSSGGKCYQLSCPNASCNCPPSPDGSCENNNGDICQCLFAQGKTESRIYNMNSENGGVVKIYCDQIMDDGGWLVIQRNNLTGPWLKKTWQEYKDGFGELDNSFWWGNEKLHQITLTGKYELRIDLKLKDAANGFAKYTGFQVSDEFDKYRLYLESSYYDGNVPDGLNGKDYVYKAVGKMFSTLDQDNDLCSSCACADVSFGGWWYGDCTKSILTTPSPEWPNLMGRIIHTEMKIRRVT